MSGSGTQQKWLGNLAPAKGWSAQAVQRTLDELFCFARRYRSSRSYAELLKFIRGFRFYSPYNAMLVHVQMPGARFVAPAHRWTREYGHSIKADARPLVILQPMGPVMFVFDVSDTEPGPEAQPLPPEVDNPFEVRRGRVGQELERTIENAKRDGIRIQPRKEGSQSAGSIRKARGTSVAPLKFQTGKDKQGNPEFASIEVRYEILFNEALGREAKYATIVHELAHLYCGHLGTPNSTWWPDRRGLTPQAEEIETESVASLLCGRLGIDNASEKYLADYLGNNQEVPDISIDVIMKVAGLIEQMGRQRMKRRKDGERTTRLPATR